MKLLIKKKINPLSKRLFWILIFRIFFLFHIGGLFWPKTCRGYWAFIGQVQLKEKCIWTCGNRKRTDMELKLLLLQNTKMCCEPPRIRENISLYIKNVTEEKLIHLLGWLIYLLDFKTFHFSHSLYLRPELINHLASLAISLALPYIFIHTTSSPYKLVSLS